MLSKYNAGKVLSKDYMRKRNQGLIDQRNLTTSEKNYADISFPDGEGSQDECTYVLYSVIKGKKYDIRKNPRRGDD